jgi:hypothetical protein
MRKALILVLFFGLFLPAVADDLKLEVAMVSPLFLDLRSVTNSSYFPFAIKPLLPIVDFHYFFLDREQMFNVGVGIRTLPYLIANAVVPDVALDGKFGSFSVRFQSAGGLYFFHVVNFISAGFALYLLPELNLFYDFNDWVSLGGGFLVMLNGEPNFPFSGLPYGMYLGLRVAL